MLQCLVVAVRPLYVEELAELLAFEFDVAQGGIPKYRPALRLDDQTQAVLSTCSSLVSIIKARWSRQVVQFSHFSVKEFLVSNRLMSSLGDISRYHIRLGSAHTVLTQACLGSLLHLGDHVTAESVRYLPLAGYAAVHWVEHAQFEDVAPRVNAGIETLFDPDKPHFAAWRDIEARVTRRYGSEKENPLYYSVLYGFYDLAEHLTINHPHCINASKTDSPLYAALSKNHIQTAEFLLEHGADVDARDWGASTTLLRVLSWLYDYDNLLNMVKLLLEHGADVNAQDRSRTSSLHLVGRYGKVEVAQILLEHKADVNIQDEDGKTPLHIVLGSEKWDKEEEASNHVRLLLEHGADMERPDKQNETPLHLAIRSNLFKLAVILLESGADANAKNDDGMAPLHILSEVWIKKRGTYVNGRVNCNDTSSLPLAMLRDRFNLARILLEHGADANAENNNGMTSLHILTSSKVDDEDDVLNLAQLLLDHGAKVDKRDEDVDSLLYRATRRNQFKLAGMLLKHGANTNAKNDRDSSLYILIGRRVDAQGNALDLARLLLEHGADANMLGEDDTTLITQALKWDQFNLAGVLVEHGADPKTEIYGGDTLLHRLAEGAGDKNLHLALLFLKHSAEVNKKNSFGDTPLHLAIRWGQFKLAELLLEHGANANAGNEKGSTAMHTLSESINKNGDDVPILVHLLLEQGAEVNRQDEENETPLHRAIRYNLCKLSRTLLEHGADANAENNNGMTPLHILSESEIEDKSDVLNLAQLLLDYGAEVNRGDKDNETPLHLAIQRDQFALAGFLLEHDTDTNLLNADLNAENNNGQLDGRTPLQIYLDRNPVWRFKSRSNLRSNLKSLDELVQDWVAKMEELQELMERETFEVMEEGNGTSGYKDMM